jgi:aspartate/methionine/tyrosine aminotransferase
MVCTLADSCESILGRQPRGFGREIMDRRTFQAFHPFTRLARLLDGVAPGTGPLAGGKPMILSIGEPRHQPPDFVAETLAEAAAGWSRYPPPRGTEGYLRAAADWLAARFGLPAGAAAPGGMIDPARHILPLPGTREGLFFAALCLASSEGDAAKPVVLLPNPFYHVYLGAALAAGAEPVFVPATAESGQLPDLAAVPPETLDRAALCYFCSPSNPQGAAADLARLTRLIELARAHGFALAFDECYSEIYTGAPPAGALQAAAALGGSLDNLLVFHSLSKRSSAPGLRCGFAVGEAGLIESLDVALRVGGAGVPLPILAAGERLWREETHVERNRALYREKFSIAERVLGPGFGFRAPAGGFFLWLDVGDGEKAAVELWRRAGIKVLPGAYMGAETPEGPNPGRAYLRAALVHDAAEVDAALTRIAEIL